MGTNFIRLKLSTGDAFYKEYSLNGNNFYKAEDVEREQFILGYSRYRGRFYKTAGVDQGTLSIRH